MDDFVGEITVGLKTFEKIESCDLICRDVRRFKFETTVYVNEVINDPGAVTESLQGVESSPFGCFCVVDFHAEMFTDIVCTTTDDKKKFSKKNT